jgi:phage repressor protein C with HTH and peptisase S24 domain
LSICERFVRILDHYGDTRYKFSKESGISEAVLSNIYQKKNPPKVEVLEFLLNKYKAVDGNWLLTGKGDMLKGSDSPSQAPASLPDTPIKEYFRKEDNFITIPIVDIAAAAGAGGALNEDYPEIVDEIKLPPFMLTRKNGRYYCGRVRGDSMFPTLVDRDYIILRFLQPGEWVEMQDREVYFIVVRDGDTYVKRIENRLATENRIICKSDNADAPHYCDFNIMGEEIAHVYHVEWRFSNNISNLKESLDESIHFKFATLEEQIKQLKDTFA